MIKRITPLLLFIGLIVADEPNSVSTDSIPSIAIMDFNVIGIDKDDALSLTERLRSEIINLKQFIVLERSAIQALLEEQKFQYSGSVDENTASELGKIIGAQYIHIGTVSKIGKTYSVDSRLINVATATAIRSADFTHKGEIDGLIEGMKSIAYQISDFSYKKTTLVKLVPIYRYWNNTNKDHFYTKNPSPKSTYKSQGVEFYAYPTQVEGTVPIYRYWNNTNKDHFYTKNPSPKSTYESQGIEFYAYPTP